MLIKMVKSSLITAFTCFSFFYVGIDAVQASHATDAHKPTLRTLEIIQHWTPERRAQAIPRDLFIDERGLGYLRMPNGELIPYGHEIPAEKASSGGISPSAGPAGGSDTIPPAITNMDPGDNATIGASYTFKATVTDDSGVKSVKFDITKSGGLTQSFTPTLGADNVWSINLQGFTDGNWSWSVVANDNAAKGGNTSTSPIISFSVDTASSGGGGSGGSGNSNAVTNGQWADGGIVQTAAGRLYFEMPANTKWKGPWNGYVCSGTVATDGETGRSLIITAAHCVYDDVNKAFARNVLFIPDQAETTGSNTDLNCSNDPLGCWAPAGGIVDVNWTTRTFPDNIAWDYAYYVVNDSGSHIAGISGSYTDPSLDLIAGSLAIDFNLLQYNTTDASDVTTALGYSYSEDPKFMYCQEDMTTEGSFNWWLPSCGLSGGSSGGPWIQSAGGTGPIISVNSWGYTNQSGMAGPKLWNTSAECLFNKAKASDLSAFESALDGKAGESINPDSCP